MPAAPAGSIQNPGITATSRGAPRDKRVKVVRLHNLGGTAGDARPMLAGAPVLFEGVYAYGLDIAQ